MQEYNKTSDISWNNFVCDKLGASFSALSIKRLLAGEAY